MILGGLITLDTANLGKRICGRLYLTRFLGKDFHVYNSGDYLTELNLIMIRIRFDGFWVNYRISQLPDIKKILIETNE